MIGIIEWIDFTEQCSSFNYVHTITYQIKQVVFDVGAYPVRAGSLVNVRMVICDINRYFKARNSD